MNDNKTPQPTGSAVPMKKQDGDDSSAPFAQMDRWDEAAMVAAITGSPIETMIYLYPVGSKKGVKDCGVDSCDFNGVKPHQHVTGIGVNGVNELARMMGGIQVSVKDVRVTNINGQPHWRAIAVAKDHFTLNWREAEATAPCGSMRRGGDDDIRGDYSRIIAQNKAERNATRKILPQHLIKGISDLALNNKITFDEEDIKRLFGPMWAERTRLKDEYFKRLVSGAMANFDVPSALPQGGTTALPDGSDAPREAQEAPQGPDYPSNGAGASGASGKPRRCSQKQYGKLRGEIRKSGYELSEEEAKAFLAANADADDGEGSKYLTIGGASTLIDEFVKGDVTRLADWLESQGKKEGPPPPKDDNEPDIQW